MYRAAQCRYFPIRDCCPISISTKASRCLSFLSCLKSDFCAFVIEQPMQCPSRLNLQTSMQGLGVFDFGMLYLAKRTGQPGCPASAGEDALLEDSVRIIKAVGPFELDGIDTQSRNRPLDRAGLID